MNFENYVSDVPDLTKYASPNLKKRIIDIPAVVIKTGLIPSASGSAYLEYEAPSAYVAKATSLFQKESSVKLSCTVFGPRPLPRSAPFTPQLLLSTYVKLAPFATRHRRNYVRGAVERDLSIHLETALRGVIIGERWPKSGIEIVITVLESEEDHPWSKEQIQADSNGPNGGWGMMSLLSGCITVASAALVDAGIDCVDLVCGGMAAIVRQPAPNPSKNGIGQSSINHAPTMDKLVVLDPVPSENQEIIAGCVVGYLPSRDEITELWVRGDGLSITSSRSRGMTGIDFLIDQTIMAAKTVRLVLIESINEGTEIRLRARNSGYLKS